MKPSRCKLVWVLAAMAAGVVAPAAQADTKENPFQRIVDRNPFGLKPPLAPPDTNAAPVVVPPAKVILTGIISMFGPASKRALFEIVEQEPGKPPVAKKPILREGERDGSVEVLSIDVEKNVVRIRNGGTEANITFEVAKATPGPAAGPAGFVPPPTAATFNPAAHAPGGQTAGPMIIGGNTTPSQGGQGVTLMGGGVNPSGAGAGGASPIPGNMANFGGAAGAANYGGGNASPAAYGYGGGGGGGGLPTTSVVDPNANRGLQQMPSRQLRTDPNPTAAGKQISREESYIQMELQRQLHERANQGGRQFPPLPPTPLSPQIQPVQ